MSSERESGILRSIRLALGRESGCVFWRNSTGVAHYEDAAGQKRAATHGLGKGSADLIGIVMTYPQHLGRFVALEVKTDVGKQSPEQAAWQRCVELNGGIYAVVRSAIQAIAIVNSVKRGGL